MDIRKMLIAAFTLAVLVTPPAMAENKAEGHKGPGKMIQKIDADSDGVVTKSEFMAAQEKRFAEMDADSDGKITADEMKALKEKWKDRKGKAPEKEVESEKSE
jgi:Ca2+-binding EF-hand superfamily protein